MISLVSRARLSLSQKQVTPSEPMWVDINQNNCTTQMPRIITTGGKCPKFIVKADTVHRKYMSIHRFPLLIFLPMTLEREI